MHDTCRKLRAHLRWAVGRPSFEARVALGSASLNVVRHCEAKVALTSVSLLAMRHCAGQGCAIS
eukprot:10292819-Prorocentrum_lima.AAC.1